MIKQCSGWIFLNWTMHLCSIRPHLVYKVWVVQFCLTFWPCGLQLASLLYHWNFLGKNAGVGCHCLLQGIFLTQGLNLGLPHCRQILHCLSHQGSPRILEWVAYPFSRGSSWPRNQTGVSCIAGRFFTSRDTREAPCFLYQNLRGLNFIFLGCIIFSRRNL